MKLIEPNIYSNFKPKLRSIYIPF